MKMDKDALISSTLFDGNNAKQSKIGLYDEF